MVLCPQCGSVKVWKDGLRYDARSNVPIQRYLCRACGYRFSQSNVNVNVSSQFLKVSNSRKNHADRGIARLGLSSKEALDGFSFNGSEDIGSHKITTAEKSLNPFRNYNRYANVCVSEGETKNMAATEIEKQTVAGTSPTTQQDAKGRLLEYAWILKKRGLAEKTIKTRTYRLSVLINKGADLLNPDTVETVLATEQWTNCNKREFVAAYRSLTKTFNIAWTPIKVRYEPKQPFIPLESELDQLIAAFGKRTATFLQVLKDTGARAGEACKLKWTDINTENNTISINDPEKGSNSRTVKVSAKTISMINAISKKYGEYIFKPCVRGIYSTFCSKRNRLADTLQNPRLRQIHFHTFRHFKATMEYQKTKDILHVKHILGHKRIENTEIYTHLIEFENDEYHSATAKNIEEAKQLIESGFEYVTDMEGIKLFRKRK
jgi:integrase